jgi:hypothetical protein
MKNIREQIGETVSRVYPEGGKVPWLSQLTTDRVNTLIGTKNKGGVGFDTSALFSRYDMYSINKVNTTADVIRETNADIWGDIKSKMEVEPKKKDC